MGAGFLWASWDPNRGPSLSFKSPSGFLPEFDGIPTPLLNHVRAVVMGWPLEDPTHSNIILTQSYRGINKVNPVFSAQEYCISRGNCEKEEERRYFIRPPFRGSKPVHQADQSLVVHGSAQVAVHGRISVEDLGED